MAACRLFSADFSMARRGVYGAAWWPWDRNEPGILDTFLTAREAIASAESSVEQNGGGAFAFSHIHGEPLILLRRFGHIWPGTENYHPGDAISDGSMRWNGQKFVLTTYDLPTRKERREMRKRQSG
jgi:hypothetical protein